MWYRISLGSVGIGCPSLCHLSTRCASPAFLVAWQGEALTLCKHCSAITKTSLDYQHCFHHKHKTDLHIIYCEENQLYPSQQTSAHSPALQVVCWPCLDTRWPPNHSSYFPALVWGPSHRVQSIGKRLLQDETPTESPVLPANLLQHLLSKRPAF